MPDKLAAGAFLENKMASSFAIIYEDRDLIVCHKPAGLPVQSARVGQKDMVSLLNNHLAKEWAEHRDSRTEKRGQKKRVREEIPSIYVVHRLDQPVEGVLVFAKTKRAAADLSRQVSDGSMRKIYRAVCCVEGWQARGLPYRENDEPGIQDSGDEHQDSVPGPGMTCRLVDYLAKDGRTNTSSVVPQGSSGAKRAELVFRVVRRWETVPDGRDHSPKAYILAEIELMTGRHHQIRVQMAHAGLPLYGDQKYNARWREFLVKEKTQLALCASSLTFMHPATGRRMTFTAESHVS